jgi:hypothetical protein
MKGTCTICCLFVALLLSITAYQQPIIRNTGNLSILTAGTMSVAGSFENAGTSSSLNNSGSLIITGDFTNNGNDLVAAGNGTTTFSGTTTQNINGSQSTSFFNLSKPNSNSVVLGNNETIKNIFTLTAGAFKLNNFTLTLDGTITGSGVLTGTASSGLIIGSTGIAGTNLGTLFFDQTTDTVTNVLKTLTITTGEQATLGNVLNMIGGNGSTGFGTVKVTGASGNLKANGNLKLKSNASGTARVDISTGNITGEVTVERYFPAIRAWRFLGIPFSSSSQSINAAWQEGLVDAVLTCPPQFTGTPGYGTEISNNNDAADGFDANNTGYPSLKYYSGNLWVVPGSTLTTNIATPNTAYCLFVRGDRNICLTNADASNVTTLRPKGVLNQINNGASIKRSFSGNTNDFILIGNPYASSVDIAGSITSGININNSSFWAWNPRLGGLYGVGGYVTLSLVGGIFVPNNPSYTAGSVIQSSQSFMVQLKSTGSGSFTFNENNKTASETVTGIFGLKANTKKDGHVVVYANLVDTTQALMDGVAAVFGKKYSAAVDSIDAQKKWNEEIENMAIIRHDTALAIEFRPIPAGPDTLFFRLYLGQKPYQIKLFSDNIPDKFPAQACLIDNYLGTQTQVDLHDTSFYSFTPNPDTNSYRNRFMLVLNCSTALPFASAKNSSQQFVLDKNSGVTIYPNPASENFTTLQFANMLKGSYEAVVYDGQGVKLTDRIIQHNGGNNSHNFPLNASWVSGIYNIRIINKINGSAVNIPLVISR